MRAAFFFFEPACRLDALNYQMPTGLRSDIEQQLERLEEVLWVTQAQAGSTDAFVKLMNRYERPILYYLRRLVPEGDFARDLHQEVWMDVFRGLPSLQLPEAFRVWIYRIAHHKAARLIRRELLKAEMNKVLPDTEIQQAQSDCEETFAAQAVHTALQEVDPHHREILVLHYLRDLSTQELSAVLGCPTGTVKSRLHHARRALRRVIERKKL